MSGNAPPLTLRQAFDAGYEVTVYCFGVSVRVAEFEQPA